ncbi:alpha/beta hydrolase [Bacillus sp. FJAT-27225]|uniref:alpha/beta fold hydrolase n=1 Tax=Bacillus sp. FJAT-27225 TaxID=1743144 RepID=UPI00080C272F|nr:alpha/beta hydrolase [Bacillus sp. FJAT-27225]OCA87957.1 alpha/beta hydrolase [Bacillus sp. FJAT-27225]
MTKVNANGIEFYYELHGEGPPLVLLEGLGYASWMWARQVEELSKQFQVVIFDNRGVGYTDKPDMEYSIQLFAEDTAALLKALNIEKAHILGVSMGGFIAQELAICHPEMVDKLILCSTSFGGTNSIPIPKETLEIMLQGASKGSDPERARYAVSTALNLETVEQNQDILDFIIAEQKKNPQPKEAYQRQLFAGASFNAEDRVQTISAETLIIAGSGDRVVPYENARLLNEQIAGSRVAIIEQTGHLFFMEAPEETNQLIINFLNERLCVDN